MPKLIIKQETPQVSWHIKYAKWLSVAGLLALLVVVAAAAWYFTRVSPDPLQRPPVLESAKDASAKVGYHAMHDTLEVLNAEYEQTAALGVDNYQKNLKLQSKAESVLGHLDKMDRLARDLGLSEDEQEALFNRHQFYKDYWEAKLHFRQLRTRRFKSGGSEAVDAITQNEELQNGQNDSSVVAAPGTNSPEAKIATEVAEGADGGNAESGKTFKFATPPPGMKLPEGFCNLDDPSASCKPEAGTDGELADLPDDDGVLNPLPESEPSAESVAAPPPKKFKFATPPPGMKLPEGFCNLDDPGASCKPEAGTGGELADFPGDDGVLEPIVEGEPSAAPVASDQPPKKFKFATPPPGMELPEGFCNLGDPNGCKPEDKAAGSEPLDLNDELMPEQSESSEVIEEAKPVQEVLSVKPEPLVVDVPERTVPSTDRSTNTTNTVSVANDQQAQAGQRRLEQDLKLLERSLGIPVN